ncbi:polyisoprenoid-binding protein [Pseudomonas fluorescens]|uniref:YceI family protein n=1 Tax=Pseudomonas lactucae TaxID=2813360 RepID=A0A9X0YCY6_9PSED|nr:YceI family protein [Pseudomonas lactucae]OPA91470.1 polyisoprenoid-binding protein [Pseudomonas fluorescens]MBN2976892.1 YceI family protein [Pseudomonas lactucae]MBN2986374.1 YceI family protein [Pseudomonas lactucae]OPB10392.1 polyisoprenoid-binding protein [Pseudomonas fluorescens]OPB21644.1 polyisoprenoid-binding protein [Pseudomonas fluorescens]
MKRRILAVALALGCIASAQAVEYKDVNPTASQISFTYMQLGQRVYGTFGQFEGTLTFDTQKPEAAHAVLKIQLASINAGSDEANDTLQRPSWFDTATYPVGVYESTGVKALGGSRFRISGNLTIKGATRPVDVQVLLKEQDGIGVFDGEFILDRGDFKIGEGEWAGNSVVSNDIHIKFKMVAPQR